MSVKAFDKHLEKEARELIADFETLHLQKSSKNAPTSTSGGMNC